jgi:hypothetical protein
MKQLQKKYIEELDVYGFETNQRSLIRAKSRLENLFPRARLHFSSENFLHFVDRSAGHHNTLFERHSPIAFDIIIANPPYVRTQVLGADVAQNIAQHYGLAGRVDLYYAFILAMGWVLAKDGTAGIIVSNRFMTTRSGASLRKAIMKSFNIRQVWDLGDTKLFDAAVLPAVLLLQQQGTDRKRSVPIFTNIYEASEESVSAHAHDPIDALRHTGIVSLNDGRRFRVQHGTLNAEAQNGDVWRIATNKSDTWLATVKAHTSAFFGDIGNVRVGIKTCADKVFIRSDWSTLPDQPELVFPLTTHHIARRFRPETPELPMKVLYPHTVVNGQRIPVDLTRYPKTAAYLEAHRDTLSARGYVTQSGRQWYEIWVPQDPDAWRSMKLVFRDISERPTFWMDKEGSVVNGDCYWLTPRSQGQDDLLWLALAVSNSTFIETFYDHSFHNKLYAGRRRFMTQYVERFPLPNPNGSRGRELIELSKRIYEATPSVEASRLEKRLDKEVWEAFGFSIEKVRR